MICSINKKKNNQKISINHTYKTQWKILFLSCKVQVFINGMISMDKRNYIKK